MLVHLFVSITFLKIKPLQLMFLLPQNARVPNLFSRGGVKRDGGGWDIQTSLVQRFHENMI